MARLDRYAQAIQVFLQSEHLLTYWLITFIHSSIGFLQQVLIVQDFIEHIKLIAKAHVRMVQDLEYLDDFIHVGSALDGCAIQGLGILHIVSQLDSVLGIEISHRWIDAHLASLHGVLLLIAAHHHALRAIARHTKHVFRAALHHLEVLVGHTTYLCNPHLVLYLLAGENHLQV